MGTNTVPKFDHGRRYSGSPDGAGKTLTLIQHGQPQQNAYVERYNRTVRYDWLAHHLFDTLDEIQDFATR